MLATHIMRSIWSRSSEKIVVERTYERTNELSLMSSGESSRRKKTRFSHGNHLRQQESKGSLCCGGMMTVMVMWCWRLELEQDSYEGRNKKHCIRHYWKKSQQLPNNHEVLVSTHMVYVFVCGATTLSLYKRKLQHDIEYSSADIVEDARKLLRRTCETKLSLNTAQLLSNTIIDQNHNQMTRMWSASESLHALMFD